MELSLIVAAVYCLDPPYDSVSLSTVLQNTICIVIGHMGVMINNKKYLIAILLPRFLSFRFPPKGCCYSVMIFFGAHSSMI